MKRTYIRIIDVPSGPAPLEIRQVWVGCILPVHRGWTGWQRWWLVPNRASKTRQDGFFSCHIMQGFPVSIIEALTILQEYAPATAKWWYDYLPEPSRRRLVFVFPAASCEVVRDFAPLNSDNPEW